MRFWLNFLVLGAGLFTGAAAWAAADKQALDAQAKRYWAAEVQQDWGTVYDMLTPADRGTQTRDEFRVSRKEQGPLHYLAAQVGEAAVAGDLGWVHVKYEFVLAKHPGAASNVLEMWQLWQYADGWRPVRQDRRDQWPELPPQRRPAAEEATLSKRASEYWQAKVAQDWKSVYPYLPPDYRERVPLERYLKNKARYLYSTPRVEWAEAKDASARVKVAFGYKNNDPATTKMEPIATTLIENWIKVSGIWYLDVPMPDDGQDVPQEKKN